VDTIILMRPTHSVTLFLQMVGRGMRPSGTPVFILDHAALVHEHLLPDRERVWNLDGSAPKLVGHKEHLRRCPACSCVHAMAFSCPNCGYEYPTNRYREVAVEDGTLIIFKETAHAAHQPKPEEPAPEGLMTISEYAERCGVEPKTVLKWISEGMPWVGEEPSDGNVH
jgi:superfamily II DNA or RNA helicase